MAEPMRRTKGMDSAKLVLDSNKATSLIVLPRTVKRGYRNVRFATVGWKFVRR
jgi:hypothetical protein